MTDDEQSSAELRDRLEHVWRQLIEEVTELTIRLHDTRDALDRDHVDDARVTSDLAIIEAKLEVSRREFAEHDAALARLAKGTYGFCGHCGQSVRADRLAASPSARLCGSCQFWSRRT